MGEPREQDNPSSSLDWRQRKTVTCEACGVLLPAGKDVQSEAFKVWEYCGEVDAAVGKLSNEKLPVGSRNLYPRYSGAPSLFSFHRLTSGEVLRFAED